MVRFLTGVGIALGVALSALVFAGNAPMAAALGFGIAVAIAFFNRRATKPAAAPDADPGLARFYLWIAIMQLGLAAIAAYLLIGEELPTLISLKANASGFFAGGAISTLFAIRKYST